MSSVQGMRLYDDSTYCFRDDIDGSVDVVRSARSMIYVADGTNTVCA